MNSSSVSRTAFFLVLLTTIAIAEDTSAYQKGTIKKDFSADHKFYVLKLGNNGYRINDCGEFQNDEVVEYRVKDKKVYIRQESGKESKCSIEAELSGLDHSNEAEAAPRPKYQKGTIEGYEIRRDTHIGGGGGGGNGTPGTPVSTWTRHAKVYEIRGADLIYKVDYCGAFQAGEFSPGQVVEFRVDSSRLYILHDNNKEYSCQLEGTRNLDTPRAQEPAPTAPSPAPAAVATAAKLSITSVPDGADIEVDGNFSGSTPSELQVPEGDRSITVKKSGYKNWERKMKVVAGSSIHLNAEMEKTTNP